MEIVPVNKNILIEPSKAEETTTSGIILPSEAQEKPRYGLVVGTDMTDAVVLQGDGEPKREHPRYPNGTKVLYKSYAGSNVKLDGKEYILMPEEDILAILKD